MIDKVQTVGICVSDQDRALAFYTEVLGFQKTTDEPMDDSGTRWLVVRPPGAETGIVLYTPPGLEDRIGSFACVVLRMTDPAATYRDLSAKGVDFVEPPTKQAWGGTMAQIKDPDGNVIILHD